MWARLRTWAEERLRQWLATNDQKSQAPEWKPGLDITDLPVDINLDTAEANLMKLEFEDDILTYIAGISPPRYRETWPMTEQIQELANSTLYRLAAVRLLVREGPYNKQGFHNSWNIDALQLYAWTGYQQEMLPWNPLFAFVRPGKYPLASLLDQSGLQHWLETASDEDLRAVKKWSSWFVESGDPELHKWYIEVLTKVGLDRLLYILEVISDTEYLETGPSHAKENIGRLTNAIAQCAASRLKVSQDGTISAEGFFSTSLVKGPIDHRP
jgi:hypothetical protein